MRGIDICMHKDVTDACSDERMRSFLVLRPTTLALFDRHVCVDRSVDLHLVGVRGIGNRLFPSS
jgi:hypothetical protein